MIKLLLPNSLRDTQNLCEMHQLRYITFVQELGWKDGIKSVNQMEFDDYDHAHAFYLVHTDKNDQVDAMVRLTQTIHPNVLLDAFSYNIADTTRAERSCHVVEISRFCADRFRAPKNVMGEIIAGLLELGLTYNISHYVSFSNVHIKPRAAYFGWNAAEIGPVVSVAGDKAVALEHVVAGEFYENVLRKLDRTTPVLSLEELERCPIRCLKMAL